MFKFVLVCALFAVAISSPLPDEVRKTGNIQKTSEYFLTAESKPPAPKSSGLARPSPINPNVQGDPKPKESGKIIPASLTDANVKSAAQPANKPAVVAATQPKVQNQQASSRTPARTVNTERRAAQATNVESAKVPAPVSPVSSVQKVNNPSVSRTVQSNNNRPSGVAANPAKVNNPTVSRTVQSNSNRPSVVASNPAAKLQSNPSIASPASPSSAKTTQPIIVGAEKKVVKRETPAKNLDTTSAPSTTTASNNKNQKSDNKNKDKQSQLSSSNDDRDNQPPKYVHPVPVTQIIKDGPPAEIHHEHKTE